MMAKKVAQVLATGVVMVVLLGFVLCNAALAEGTTRRAELWSSGTGIIAGVVYQDWDEDGVRDDEEPGLPGATIVLYDLRGKPVRETVSDGDGAYLLTASARSYLLQVTPPEGYTVLQEAGVPVVLRADETTTLDSGVALWLRVP